MLFIPVGLKRLDQLRFVVRHLAITPGFPRCTHCNGPLNAVPRADVADEVPARSLIWTREFYRCRACRHVFWEGTHWNRIHRVRDQLFPDVPPS
jgi:uncharacterized protein with PIN domain